MIGTSATKDLISFPRETEALKWVPKFWKIIATNFFNKLDGGEIFHMSLKQKHCFRLFEKKVPRQKPTTLL